MAKGLFGYGSSSDYVSSESSTSPAKGGPGQARQYAANPNVTPLNPEGLKPCCACPDTKSARDECFFKSNPDEANEKCKELVEKHKACMRGYGFKV